MKDNEKIETTAELQNAVKTIKAAILQSQARAAQVRLPESANS